jgi:hypothetical protein
MHNNRSLDAFYNIDYKKIIKDNNYKQKFLKIHIT